MKTWERYKTDPVYRDRIAKRRKIVEAVRDFFASEGFVEIETPLLTRAPGMEPNLSPFVTSITPSPYQGEGRGEVVSERRGSMPAYLVTSPEYSCKKMLAAGIPKLFSLGKVFRNEEQFGHSHNPEFTMLEWYRANADYTVIMDDTERLVRHCIAALEGTGYRVQGTATSVPWERLSVKETFAHIGINLDECLTRDTMAKAARAKGYAVTSNDSFDDCFFKIFLTEIEPRLGRGKPTILYDYPIQMAALARAKPTDPRYAERFEVYAGGLELANAFGELTDATEQRRRLLEEQKLRGTLGKDQPPVDEDFLAALATMPPSSGIALGIDRLVMLLTGTTNIEDVLLFPASDLFES